MSISSAAEAEYSNRVKDRWLAALMEAANNKDWDAVNRLILEMEKFRFTE